MDNEVSVRESWTMKLLYHIGVVKQGMISFVKEREHPRIFYDTTTEILYVGEDKFFGVTFTYFPTQHYLRRGAILLTCDPWFRNFSVFCILVHSVSVLMQEPTSMRNLADSDAWGELLLVVADRILLFFFAIEFALTALANGMRRSLMTPFKFLDFLIIVVAFMLEVVDPGSPLFMPIFALNALRPIRSIHRVRGMYKLVGIIYEGLPTMASVLVLIACIVFIFSMAGVILFNEVLHQRCIDENDEMHSICAIVGDEWKFLYTPCPSFTNCTSGVPPPSRWQNFDNVGTATLSIIQVVTLEDWTQVCQDVMDGWSPFAAIFFFICTVVGAFWATNLVLAVVTDTFSRRFAEEQEEQEEQLAKEQGKEIEKKKGVSAALQGNLETGGKKSKTKLDKREVHQDSNPARGTAPVVKQHWRQWVRRLSVAATRSLKSGLASVDIKERLKEYDENFPPTPSEQSEEDEETKELKKIEAEEHREKLERILLWQNELEVQPEGIETETHLGLLEHPLLFVPDVDAESNASDFDDLGGSVPLSVHERNSQVEHARGKFDKKNKKKQKGQKAPSMGLFEKYNTVSDPEAEMQYKRLLKEEEEAVKRAKEKGKSRSDTLTKLKAEMEQRVKGQLQKRNRALFDMMKRLYLDPRRENALFGFVIANAVFLLSVQYRQPFWLTLFLNVFTGLVDFLILLDFVLNITFIGGRRYIKAAFRSLYKLAECIVVILCAFDLFFVIPGVLWWPKMLRILRVMKYMKRFPLLRTILKAMRSSLYYLANLMALLVIFIMVFTVLGVHMFYKAPKPVVQCHTFHDAVSCEKIEDCLWVNRTEWLGGKTYNAELEWGNEEIHVVSRTLTLSSISGTSTPASNVTSLILPNKHHSLFSCRQFRGWNHVDLSTRFHFGDFFNGFLTVFNLLTKDAWPGIMYRYMTDVSPVACLFFYVILAVGSYILMSLLVAILLVNFGRDEQQAKAEKDDIEEAREEVLKADEEEMGIVHEAKEEVALEVPLTDIYGPLSTALPTPATEKKEEEGEAKSSIVGEEETAPKEKRCRDYGVVVMLIVVVQWFLNWSDAKDRIVDHHDLQGRSFFFFSKTNKFRKIAARIVSGEFFPFEKAVFLISLIHCVVTTINEDLLSDVLSQAMVAVTALDWIIVLVTIVETLLRMIAEGALHTEHSYVSYSKLNLCDFIVVCCSVGANFITVSLTFIPHIHQASLFLKAFRPLRLVSRSGAMRNVLFAISKTVPSMLRVLGLSAVVYLLVAVIAVEAFQGKLRTCNDGSDRSEMECEGKGFWRATPADEVVMIPSDATFRYVEREWKNMNYYHFDNVFNSFTTLFEVSTVSAWGFVMFGLMDSSKEMGGRPIRENNQSTAAFFVFWVFLGNLVLLNIFVGTVVDQFMRLKLEMQGSIFLTEEQSEVAHIKKLLHQSGAKKVLTVPDDKWINKEMNIRCFAMQANPIFIYIMKFAVILNVALIMTFHYNQADAFTNIQVWSNVAVTFFFTVEMLVKMCVAGPKPYVAIASHRLDALVAVQSWIELVLFFVMPSYRRTQTLQLFRLLRVFRLVREQKGFRRLLHTGYRSLPALGNIGALLLVVFYMFSMIGIAFFSEVRFVPESREYLNQNMNFRTFPRAMFTLYRVATLDDWGIISGASGLSEPFCDDRPEINDCGNKTLARIFFNTFILSVGFVMLNLFIAVVLENFSESVLLPTYMHERMADVNLFRSVWASFDPKGRQCIPAAMFVPLLRSLPGPNVRLGQLRQRAEKAGDSDSVCSWTEEEIQYYAAHCAVGLKGEPFASTIPTLGQLNLPVTFPRQEILFADAIDAIGEKIFHVKLVDQRTSHVHQKAKAASEYEHNFQIVDYYCATTVQHAWRRFARERDDPAAQKKKGAKSKWDEVLGPILQQVWAHHAEGVFGQDESAEEAAKYRKLVKGKRKREMPQGVEENVVEQEKAEAQHVKAKMTVAEALKAQMQAVDEQDDTNQDDLWKGSIEAVESAGSSDDSDGENFWIPTESKKKRTTEANELRRRGKLAEGEKHVSFELPQLYDRGESTPYQLPTLNEIIQRRKKQLQLELQAHCVRTNIPYVPGSGAFLAHQVSLLPHNLKSPIPISTPYRRKWQPEPHRTSKDEISVEEVRGKTGQVIKGLVYEEEATKQSKEAKGGGKSHRKSIVIKDPKKLPKFASPTGTSPTASSTAVKPAGKMSASVQQILAEIESDEDDRMEALPKLEEVILQRRMLKATNLQKLDEMPTATSTTTTSGGMMAARRKRSNTTDGTDSKFEPPAEGGEKEQLRHLPSDLQSRPRGSAIFK